MARRRKKRAKGGFRARARGAGRRIRRGARRFRARKVRMGLIGKTGVIVAGGIPIGFSAAEAIAPWTSVDFATLPINEKLKASLAAFTNTLTMGFGLGTAVPKDAVTAATLSVPAYGSVTAASYLGAPWIKTTAAGISLVVIDGVIGTITRFAAGGRARPKIMGRQLISG